MMQKTFLSLLLALSIVSCNNSRQDIEGFWVESYRFYPESKIDTGKVRSDYGHFLNIKENTIHIKNFNRKAHHDTMLDSVSSFTEKITPSLLEENLAGWSDFEVYEDSLVATVNFGEKIQITYRKLPKRTQKVNWNPEGKRYKVQLPNDVYYHDYKNNEDVYVYWANENEVGENSWSIENIDNYSFLLNESIVNITPLLIDSISGTKIYITDYTRNKSSIVLEEFKTQDNKPEALFGTWKLVSKETSANDKYDAITKNNLQVLIIEKDSISILKKPFKSTISWEYFEAENAIVLNSLLEAINIVQFQKDTLVLEMDLSHMSDHRKFTFTREK